MPIDRNAVIDALIDNRCAVETVLSSADVTVDDLVELIDSRSASPERAEVRELMSALLGGQMEDIVREIEAFTDHVKTNRAEVQVAAPLGKVKLNDLLIALSSVKDPETGEVVPQTSSVEVFVQDDTAIFSFTYVRSYEWA